MRAVKDGLPVPYGESEESEGPQSMRAVEPTQSPCQEKRRTNYLENFHHRDVSSNIHDGLRELPWRERDTVTSSAQLCCLAITQPASVASMALIRGV